MNKLQQIESMLHAKGYNAHIEKFSVYAHKGTKKLTEFEIREALDDLGESIQVYPLRFGVKVMPK